jgi:hypothetical protein
MRHPSDPERLLGEILAEAEPGGFRAALLDQTLHLARQRRWQRRFRRSTAILSGVALGILLAWRLGSAEREFAGHRAPSDATVRTAALPAVAIVRTQRLDRDGIVASTAGVEVVRTTAASSRFQAIGDEELLALANPRAAMLVRRGPHSTELIFTPPNGREDSPLD